MPTLVGHFAVFNQWTEINSWFEGNFLERIAPGAFKKTFAENRSNMKVLFQHGMDPQIGDKPLGPIDTLKEDRTGGYYEVPLLDTGYVPRAVPGLEADLYGASFRFAVMREEIVDEPGVSAYNPKGIQERTIQEAKVIEFGPVTFPAYARRPPASAPSPTSSAARRARCRPRRATSPRACAARPRLGGARRARRARGRRRRRPRARRRSCRSSSRSSWAASPTQIRPTRPAPPSRHPGTSRRPAAPATPRPTRTSQPGAAASGSPPSRRTSRPEPQKRSAPNPTQEER
jgi:HK97 family phage prohead protease